jgi:hypothetical protein
MNKFDCRYLTGEIAKLSKLGFSLDSALAKFDVRNSLNLQEEIGKSIIEVSPADVCARLGQEQFDYFVEVFGGVEAFMDRMVTVEVSNKTAGEIETDLLRNGIFVDQQAERIYAKFSKANVSEKMILLRLEARHLGVDAAYTMPSFYQKIKDFHLQVCPAEAVPAFLLSEKIKSRGLSESLLIGMQTLFDKFLAYEVVYYIRKDDEDEDFSTILTSTFAGSDDLIDDNQEILVRIPERKKRKGGLK